MTITKLPHPHLAPPLIPMTPEIPCRKLFIDIFGENVYLVGGTLRDYLLCGRSATERDIDLVVVGHTCEQIEAKLKPWGKTNTVGKSFAVVKFCRDGLTFDVAAPRKDTRKSPDSHSHKNFIIDSGPHIPLRDDLLRRDFTCNSIAMRLSDNSWYDPFDGQSAVRQRRIIITSPDTFCDDPLRLLRAARFASVLQFAIDPAIYEIAKNVPLSELSKERITEELFRMLLESPQPSAGLWEYLRLTILEKLFPSLYPLTLTIQDALFHPETDDFGHHTVWAHTLIALDLAHELAVRFNLNPLQTLALLLATLLHDIGKPAATRWEWKRGRMTITSLFHDSKGEIIADAFLSDFKIDTRKNFPLKDVILKLVKYHHRFFELFKNRESTGFKAISRLVRDLGEFDFLLLLLDVADRRSRMPEPERSLEPNKYDEVIHWYQEQKKIFNLNRETVKPLVMGRHLIALGVTPGVAMGAALDTLCERQLDGDFSTLEQGLALFRSLFPHLTPSDEKPTIQTHE